MSDAIQTAREEIAARAVEISQRASSASAAESVVNELKLKAEVVKICADAVHAVAFAPHDGDYFYNYLADYHETRHEGTRRERPAGFSQSSREETS